MQNSPDQVELDLTVLIILQEPSEQGGQVRLGDVKAPLQLGQQEFALLIIHRPPVIGIDEAIVPQLRTLVKIRHTWNCHFKNDLGQGIEQSEEGDFALEQHEIVQEQILRRISQ